MSFVLKSAVVFDDCVKKAESQATNHNKKVDSVRAYYEAKCLQRVFKTLVTKRNESVQKSLVIDAAVAPSPPITGLFLSQKTATKCEHVSLQASWLQQ